MNILICSSYSASWNGVRPEAEMFINIAKLGHSVTIMTQGDAQYVDRFRRHGIKVIDCYPKRKICLSTIARIRQELRHQHYDVVYAMNSKTIPNAAFACIGFKKTKMITYRGTVGGLYRHDPSAYLTHLHPRVNAVCCVAKAVENDVKRRVWFKQENVVTIYKGHNVEWYQTTPSNLSDLGIPENSIVAICIANARPSKGVHVLIESAKHLSELTNLHLLLVGNDIDTEANVALANASGMAERIHFLGFRNDVPELLAASHIQVQPSVSGEGLPKTLVEAMSSAVPSVITTTGGGKELIINEQSGFVVPVNDPIAMANKIQRLYESSSLREEIGKSAQQRVREKYSSLESAKQHVAFFEQLLKR